MLSTKNKQECWINAATNGRIDDVKKCLNDGTVDVNGKNINGLTALHLACHYGYRDVAELLLDHGADIEVRSSSNDTPLIQACFCDHAPIVKLLLDRGCAINADKKDGFLTALHYACSTGATQCVKELLAHGADPFKKGRTHGSTPFALSKVKKNQAVIDLLMEHKKRSEQNLMVSNDDKKKSTLSERKDKAAVMSSENKQKCLINAARYGSIDDVKKYLNDGTVDVNGKNIYGQTALHLACYEGHCDIVDLLLDHGADIEVRSSRDSTPLMMASRNDRAASITKLLLHRGCAMNAVNDFGDTALHWACKRGSTECVKELLTHGADATIKNEYGSTPFDVAKEGTVIDLLMEHKKWSGQHLQDEKKSILSEVSTLKAEDFECLVSTLDERLSSKVESIINRRCEELHDMIASKQEEMNQTVQKLTSDFEALRNELTSAANQDKIVTNQLASSNAEVVKCISNISTIVMNLSLKGPSSQVHFDSNEGTIIERHQHVDEDDFEMIP